MAACLTAIATAGWPRASTRQAVNADADAFPALGRRRTTAGEHSCGNRHDRSTRARSEGEQDAKQALYEHVGLRLKYYRDDRTVIVEAWPECT